LVLAASTMLEIMRITTPPSSLAIDCISLIRAALPAVTTARRCIGMAKDLGGDQARKDSFQRDGVPPFVQLTDPSICGYLTGSSGFSAANFRNLSVTKFCFLK